MLVAIHEAGHLFAARLLGMRVEVYSIGWGRAIWSRVGKSGTEYRISIVPIGGYCRIAGMAESESDTSGASDPDSYAAKPPWSRFAAIAAGPLMNYATAFVLACGLLMAGRPAPSNIVDEIVPGKPAALAGVQPGDRILSIGDRTTKRWADIPPAVEALGPRGGTMVVERGDQKLSLELHPSLEGGTPRIGVGRPRAVAEPGLPPLTAFTSAARWVWENNAEIVRSLGRMVRGREKAQLSGPLGIVRETAEQASRGALSFLVTLSLLSVALAIFNFLPIPPLDGGRLVFLVIEMVAGRRVPAKIENAVHIAGFAMFLILVVIVSAGDIMRWAHVITGK